MVVADKNALRSLDKAASRASQYKHPAIKLTNMVVASKNGAYRDPDTNTKQGGAKNSRHQYGDGFDIWTKGWTETQRAGILRNLYDIGFRAFGHGHNNIHADMRPGKSIVQWNYGDYPIPSKSSYESMMGISSQTMIAESFENFISDYIVNEKAAVTRAGVARGDHSGGGGSTRSSSEEKSGEETPLDVKKGVGGKVNWGNSEQSSATSAAWNYLRPFLPKGTSLNSVMRGQESQDRIARNMSKKRGYSGDLEGAYKFLKSKGVAIARRVGVGHGGKNGSAAFDLSGKAGLDAIADAVTKVSNDPVMSQYVTFEKFGNKSPPYSLIERKNNAVHVLFYLKNVKVPYDSSAVGKSSLPKTEATTQEDKKKST